MLDGIYKDSAKKTESDYSNEDPFSFNEQEQASDAESRYSAEIDELADRIGQPGSWNFAGFDLVPQLITLLPEWQRAGVVLEIDNNGYISRFAESSPVGGENLVIRLKYINNNHYNVMIDGEQIEVEADGECFFSCVWLALRNSSGNAEQIIFAQEDGLSRQSAAAYFRHKIADYVRKNPRQIYSYLLSFNDGQSYCTEDEPFDPLDKLDFDQAIDEYSNQRQRVWRREISSINFSDMARGMLNGAADVYHTIVNTPLFYSNNKPAQQAEQYSDGFHFQPKPTFISSAIELALDLGVNDSLSYLTGYSNSINTVGSTEWQLAKAGHGILTLLGLTDQPTQSTSEKEIKLMLERAEKGAAAHFEKHQTEALLFNTTPTAKGIFTNLRSQNNITSKLQVIGDKSPININMIPNSVRPLIIDYLQLADRVYRGAERNPYTEWDWISESASPAAEMTGDQVTLNDPVSSAGDSNAYSAASDAAVNKPLLASVAIPMVVEAANELLLAQAAPSTQSSRSSGLSYGTSRALYSISTLAILLGSGLWGFTVFSSNRRGAESGETEMDGPRAEAIRDGSIDRSEESYPCSRSKLLKQLGPKLSEKSMNMALFEGELLRYSQSANDSDSDDLYIQTFRSVDWIVSLTPEQPLNPNSDIKQVIADWYDSLSARYRNIKEEAIAAIGLLKTFLSADGELICENEQDIINRTIQAQARIHYVEIQLSRLGEIRAAMATIFSQENQSISLLGQPTDWIKNKTKVATWQSVMGEAQRKYNYYIPDTPKEEQDILADYEKSSKSSSSLAWSLDQYSRVYYYIFLHSDGFDNAKLPQVISGLQVNNVTHAFEDNYRPEEPILVERLKTPEFSLADIKNNTQFDSNTDYYNQFVNYTRDSLKTEAEFMSTNHLLNSTIGIVNAYSIPKKITSYSVSQRHEKYNTATQLVINTWRKSFGEISILEFDNNDKYLISTMAYNIKIAKMADGEKVTALLNKGLLDRDLMGQLVYEIYGDKDISFMGSTSSLGLITADIFVGWQFKERKNRPTNITTISFIDEKMKEVLSGLAEIMKTEKYSKAWWEYISMFMPFINMIYRGYHDSDYSPDVEEYLGDTIDFIFTVVTLGVSLYAISQISLKTLRASIRRFMSKGLTGRTLHIAVLQDVLPEMYRVGGQIGRTTAIETASFLNPIPFSETAYSLGLQGVRAYKAHRLHDLSDLRTSPRQQYVPDNDINESIPGTSSKIESWEVIPADAPRTAEQLLGAGVEHQAFGHKPGRSADGDLSESEVAEKITVLKDKIEEQLFVKSANREKIKEYINCPDDKCYDASLEVYEALQNSEFSPRIIGMLIYDKVNQHMPVNHYSVLIEMDGVKTVVDPTIDQFLSSPTKNILITTVDNWQEIIRTQDNYKSKFILIKEFDNLLEAKGQLSHLNVDIFSLTKLVTDDSFSISNIPTLFKNAIVVELEQANASLEKLNPGKYSQLTLAVEVEKNRDLHHRQAAQSADSSSVRDGNRLQKQIIKQSKLVDVLQNIKELEQKIANLERLKNKAKIKSAYDIIVNTPMSETLLANTGHITSEDKIGALTLSSPDANGIFSSVKGKSYIRVSSGIYFNFKYIGGDNNIGAVINKKKIDAIVFFDGYKWRGIEDSQPENRAGMAKYILSMSTGSKVKEKDWQVVLKYLQKNKLADDFSLSGLTAGYDSTLYYKVISTPYLKINQLEELLTIPAGYFITFSRNGGNNPHHVMITAGNAVAIGGGNHWFDSKATDSGLSKVNLRNKLIWDDNGNIYLPELSDEGVVTKGARITIRVEKPIAKSSYDYWSFIDVGDIVQHRVPFDRYFIKEITPSWANKIKANYIKYNKGKVYEFDMATNRYIKSDKYSVVEIPSVKYLLNVEDSIKETLAGYTTWYQQFLNIAQHADKKNPVLIENLELGLFISNKMSKALGQSNLHYYGLVNKQAPKYGEPPIYGLMVTMELDGKQSEKMNIVMDQLVIHPFAMLHDNKDFVNEVNKVMPDDPNLKLDFSGYQLKRIGTALTANVIYDYAQHSLESIESMMIHAVNPRVASMARAFGLKDVELNDIVDS